MKKHLSALLPIIIWSGCIFLLSNQPTLPGPELATLDFIFKKSAHMFVYGVLYALVYRAVLLYTQPRPSLSIWAGVITFLYAASDELHQAFVPGRHPAFMDLGFDALGMFIAWLKIHDYI